MNDLFQLWLEGVQFIGDNPILWPPLAAMLVLAAIWDLRIIRWVRHRRTA